VRVVSLFVFEVIYRIRGRALKMSWISETREQQQNLLKMQNQRMLLISESSGDFFSRLEAWVRFEVAEINQEYPERFNRATNDHLELVGGTHNCFRVYCGPNIALEVIRLTNGRALKAIWKTRREHLQPSRQIETNFFFEIDANGQLCLQSKHGQNLTVDAASREFLRFLIE